MRRILPHLSTVVATGLLSLLGAAFGVTAPSFAATGTSLAISPTFTDAKVDPGASVTRTVTVVNNGSEPFKVVLSASPYSMQNSAYNDPNFNQLPNTTNTTQWFSFNQLTATIPAHDSEIVPYTITVPAATAPGGYYAVLFVRTVADSPSENGVTIQNRLGNIQYITVNGPVKQHGSVSADPLPKFIIGKTLPISLTIKNDGGVHFQSSVSMTAKDSSGKQVYFNTPQVYVLPGTERVVTKTWTAASPVGVYTVSRSATVPGGTITLPDQKVFVISPFILLFIAVGIVAIILLIATRILKNRRHFRTNLR